MTVVDCLRSKTAFPRLFRISAASLKAMVATGTHVMSPVSDE